MTTQEDRTHVIILPRRAVLDLMHQAYRRKEQRCEPAFCRWLVAVIASLDGALAAAHGDDIELRGTHDWFARLLESCGNVRIALHVGQQLQECE